MFKIVLDIGRVFTKVLVVGKSKTGARSYKHKLQTEGSALVKGNL